MDETTGHGTLKLALPEEGEQGGIVTTVKKETTDDLDVKEAMADQENEKPKEPPKAKPVEDDDDDELDFKSLNPKQQRAVGKLFKERRETAKRLRALEGTVDELRRGQKTDTKAGDVPAADELQIARPKRPDPSQFKSDADFDKAQEEYEDKLLDYRDAVKNAKAERERMETERERIVTTYNEAVEKFIEANPDYEEVMDQDTPMSRVMFGAVLESGPALGYYLAKHPDESAKIYKMSQNDAYKALMRIVVRLEDQKPDPPKKDPPKPKQREPEPPEPLKGRGGSLPQERPRSFRDREKAIAQRRPGDLNYEP